MFWSIGVILVNAYVVYCTFLQSSGVKKEDIMSHHDFRKAIALASINPAEYYIDSNTKKSRSQAESAPPTKASSTGKKARHPR